MDERLRSVLEVALGSAISGTTPVHGGDVAIAYELHLDDGRVVFAKTHADPPPHLFTTEGAGLSWLRAAGSVLVPEVLSVADDPAHLALEWIERGAPTRTTETDLGRSLAALHRAGASCFGREDRRTTGSRRMPNDPCATWAEFYAERRLRPLARSARDTGALDDRTCRALDDVAGRLDAIFPTTEPPARLHGDLWAGNRVVDTAGRSWLVDPAAHGGHREFDLAMMRLFGGFGPDCFAAYAEVAPLEDGWEERIELHQLAPLAVHAIKFGGSYVRATEQALARYR